MPENSGKSTGSHIAAREGPRDGTAHTAWQLGISSRPSWGTDPLKNRVPMAIRAGEMGVGMPTGVSPQRTPVTYGAAVAMSSARPG